MQTALHRILYIDALAGAGKTYAIVRYAHKLVTRGGKVIIAQPTKQLIDRTVADELSQLSVIRHRVIHGDATPSVIAEIVRHLNECGDEPELLFITQAAFFALPFFSNRDRWAVILDEVPQIDAHDEFNLPDNHALLFPHLRIEDEDGRYGLVTPKGDAGKAALARMAKNERDDDVSKLLSGFAGRVTSADWEVRVLNTQFADIETVRRDLKRLQAFSILQPSCLGGFRSVIIAGACFKDTLLYRLWDAHGVEFKALELPLRYDVHTCGDRLTIKYVTEDPWSKALRNRPAAPGSADTVASQVRTAILSDVGTEPFLWMGNKDVPDDYFGVTNATRLPNSPHGLNSYQGFHNTIVYSALNPTASHFGFLGNQGIDAEAVRTALYRHTTYQAVMRSSLRNPADLTPKRVIVMDRATAEWLAMKFPGAVVEALDGLPMTSVRGKPGRPPIHASDYDRKAAHTRNKARALLIEQGTINEGDLTGDRAGIPIFMSKFDSKPFAHLEYPNDDEFIEALRDLHERNVATKESAGLLSPAFFDPDLSSDTSRGLPNVRHLRGIWLDNDGGDLSHTEFVRLFPSLRIVVWNTFSSTPENPRWRAFIPTTGAMSLSVHRIILAQILSDLNGHGFWSAEQLAKNAGIKRRRTHGFDMSKLNAASLFYLPAKAANPRGSFFEDHGHDRRLALEPVRWINRAVRSGVAARHAAAEAPTPTIPPESGLVQGTATDAHALPNREAKKAAAIRDWTVANQQAGEGHRAFYRLALRLVRAGLTHSEIRDILHEEARWARSPAERRGEIARIIRKFQQRRPARARAA